MLVYNHTKTGGYMKELRVRIENTDALCKALHEAGYEASWRHGCRHTLNHGCADPNCNCPKHISFYEPEKWATITTNCSGNKAHMIWKQAGVFDNKKYD